MATFRIATFNVENLFARYCFRQGVDATTNGFTINDTAFDIYNETEKQIAAKVIREVNADVLCLQEVESVPVLQRFNSESLAPLKYKYRLVIDGNDARCIDVAVEVGESRPKASDHVPVVATIPEAALTPK